jgi:hypothetical protein
LNKKPRAALAQVTLNYLLLETLKILKIIIKIQKKKNTLLKENGEFFGMFRNIIVI